jgi:hypothetical protein
MGDMGPYCPRLVVIKCKSPFASHIYKNVGVGKTKDHNAMVMPIPWFLGLFNVIT